MENNSAKIGTMMSFTDKDDFYFIQILKRRKDNPDLGVDMEVINTYYIESLGQYIKLVPQIIRLCDLENARGYFWINKRNYTKLGPHMAKRVIDVVFSDSCIGLKKTFNSICGEFHSDPDKKWIVDIDWKNFEHEEDYSKIISLLDHLQLIASRTPMTEILPTKNGVHIITRPFDLSLFKIDYPGIDVHKDNCTILYCP
jgi:hypothetical protein